MGMCFPKTICMGECCDVMRLILNIPLPYEPAFMCDNC